MDRQETRRARLAQLVERAGSQAALAERIETAASHISNILNKGRNVSNSMVERLEAAYRLPSGWMDQWVTPPASNSLSDSDKALLAAYHALPDAIRLPVRATIESTAVALDPKYHRYKASLRKKKKTLKTK